MRVLQIMERFDGKYVNFYTFILNLALSMISGLSIRHILSYSV